MREIEGITPRMYNVPVKICDSAISGKINS